MPHRCGSEDLESEKSSLSSSSPLEVAMTPAQRIGLFLAVFATCCLYFGVVWSFDNGLLMLGNAALLASLALILGPWSVLALFVDGARGVLPFLLGVSLVFYNFRLLGMLLELYGACLLVMAALPQLLEQIRELPYIGWLVPRLFNILSPLL